jgi:hypothetical protein
MIGTRAYSRSAVIGFLADVDCHRPIAAAMRSSNRRRIRGARGMPPMGLLGSQGTEYGE